MIFERSWCLHTTGNILIWNERYFLENNITEECSCGNYNSGKCETNTSTHINTHVDTVESDNDENYISMTSSKTNNNDYALVSLVTFGWFSRRTFWSKLPMLKFLTHTHTHCSFVDENIFHCIKKNTALWIHSGFFDDEQRVLKKSVSFRVCCVIIIIIIL